MKESLQEIDRVLLVSGMTAPDKRIEQHHNVIEAAQAAGVSKKGSRNGTVDNESHFAQAARREHLNWPSFSDGLR